MKPLYATRLLAILASTVFMACSGAENNNERATHTTEESDTNSRLSISKNPEAFNTAFNGMMESYYNVKNALINWDSTTASTEANILARRAEALPLSLLKADSSIVLTAQNFAGDIKAQSEKLAGAKSMDAERRAFSSLSDKLYSLINTVRYDKEVIYYAVCPMAFNESERAYWLSDDSTISNPYLGNKHPKYHSAMMNCGEVEDRIDYAGRQ